MAIRPRSSSRWQRGASGRRPLAVLTAVLVVTAALPLVPAAGAGSLPRLEYGPEAVVRPATFYGWSGDGSVVLGGPSSEPPLPNQAGGSYGHIEWTVWNHRVAIGHGIVWYDDCQPDCGTGQWHSEPPTRVKAYRVRGGEFTRLRAKLGEGARRHWYLFAYTHPYPPQWEKISG